MLLQVWIQAIRCFRFGSKEFAASGLDTPGFPASGLDPAASGLDPMRLFVLDLVTMRLDPTVLTDARRFLDLNDFVASNVSFFSRFGYHAYTVLSSLIVFFVGPT